MNTNQLLLEFAVGAFIVVVVSTMKILLWPFAVVLLIAGIWAIGKWTLYWTLTWRERWVRDQIARGRR